MSTSGQEIEPLRWYAARTRHGQEISVRDKLTQAGIENFIPTSIGYRIRQGHKVRTEKPLINNLVFLKAEKTRACQAANALVPIYFLIDHGTNSLLVVPEKQMDDFKKVLDLDPEAIKPDMVDLAPGSKVRVVKGALSGIEGCVTEITNKTYVVLSLCGLVQARVEIPKAYLEKI